LPIFACLFQGEDWKSTTFKMAPKVGLVARRPLSILIVEHFNQQIKGKSAYPAITLFKKLLALLLAVGMSNPWLGNKRLYLRPPRSLLSSKSLAGILARLRGCAVRAVSKFLFADFSGKDRLGETPDTAHLQLLYSVSFRLS
jgi:hypothetical protein